MATKTWMNHLTSPISPDVDPTAVIATLHNHDLLLGMGNKTFAVSKREPAASNLSENQAITRPHHESSPDRTLHGRHTERVYYDINDKFSVLPGGLWMQRIKFTAWFENTPDGLITRFETPGGLISRTVYSVRRRNAYVDAVAIDTDNGDRAGEGIAEQMSDENDRVQDDWVLDEQIESSCCFLLKPFVESKLVSSRRETHRKIFAAAAATS